MTSGPLGEPATAAANVFSRLIDYMPLPPLTEDGALAEAPSLEFTKVRLQTGIIDNVSVLSSNNYLLQVECLMFAFHAIGRQDETFLKSDEERLKDFRSRLQYLARGVQGYIKKLKEVLAKPAPGTSHEDRQIKQIALRTNENIQTMIRDLFHSPPIYKANITLSFKPKQDKAKDAGGPKPGQKRKPITFTKAEGGGGGGAGGKRRALYMDTVSGGGPGRSYNKPHVSSYKPPGKQARPSGHYAPPGGKFSGKIKDRRGSWSNN